MNPYELFRVKFDGCINLVLDAGPIAESDLGSPANGRRLDELGIARDRGIDG